jgi:hypothetical protein
VNIRLFLFKVLSFFVPPEKPSVDELRAYAREQFQLRQEQQTGRLYSARERAISVGRPPYPLHHLFSELPHTDAIPQLDDITEIRPAIKKKKRSVEELLSDSSLWR